MLLRYTYYLLTKLKTSYIVTQISKKSHIHYNYNLCPLQTTQTSDSMMIGVKFIVANAIEDTPYK